jgi:hypothetical protein
MKKIRRLMRKYGLFCPIRAANPHRGMSKVMQNNNVVCYKFAYTDIGKWGYPPRSPTTLLAGI